MRVTRERRYFEKISLRAQATAVPVNPDTILICETINQRARYRCYRVWISPPGRSQPSSRNIMQTIARPPRYVLKRFNLSIHFFFLFPFGRVKIQRPREDIYNVYIYIYFLSRER